MTPFVHHICIQTNQYEASKAFYLALGFKLEEETPNFHGRDFNTWLSLDGFFIELQTGKKELTPFDKNHEGIQHLCLYTDDLNAAIESLATYSENFIKKEGKIIYHVANGELFKLTAPEGTIIEYRNNLGI